MIVELTVENLAIIERAQISLGAGFTALTGETGAGKSLLIDAINLALGERADADLVRGGADKASVSVVLDLSGEADALARCAEFGIPLDEGRLFIQREVAAKGGSQCRIGGKLTPVNTLRQVGEVLVDLHGQHDHQSLLNPEGHISYLDDWIGAPVAELRAQVALAFEQLDASRKRLASLRSSLREREQRLDLLRFQLNEIEAANPLPGETDQLSASLNRLQYAEKLATAAFGALEVVADQENCAVDQLAGGVKLLEAAVRYDSSLAEVLNPLQAALIEVEEAAHRLRAYAEGLEADPARLDEIQARLDTLKRLRRKYGATEEDVLTHLEAVRADLLVLEDSEASEELLAAEVIEKQAALDRVANALSALRRERAKEFDALVTAQLKDLAMERAIFSVDFQSKPADASGADDAQFHFSANTGEPARPLSKIASGGEISRVMLAIKSALAGKAGVPTLIFDEVDVGLGGRAAATMARKLEELARHYQVVVISHLPQIASRAARHFRIEKVEVSGRVVTQVRELEGAERVEEIARMLAGDRVTDTALANARELLGLPVADRLF